MRIFLLAFAALVTFSNISCQRTTAASAPAGVINPEASVANSEGTPTSIALPEIEITRFTPLDDDERFAFTLDNIEVPPPIWGMHNMTLYAVRNDDIEGRRKLFAWEDVVDTDGVQFTSDFRTVFFTVRREYQDSSQYGNYLFKADGATGEIRQLKTTVPTGFRVTKDGRFVAFLIRWYLPDFKNNIFARTDREQANVFVFDIGTKTIRQLTWRTNEPIDGAWSLFRLDNFFRIHGITGIGNTIAVAELNPATMELEILWDVTDPNNRIPPRPNTFFHDWDDDVILQNWDSNIRLR